MDHFEKIARFKEEILKNHPRLSSKDSFQFKCHKDLKCFNVCCSDVNIFLTPYDVIRMKNRLGLKSEEFLPKYTLSPFDKRQKLPIVVMKMNDNEEKNCQFVDKNGCTIYEDRPWACRMYPLGVASPKEEDKDNKEFYFLLKEDQCEGFKEKHNWTVEEWMKDQGIEEYNTYGKLFSEITLHDYFKSGNLSPEKMDMFYNVCYNIDKFKEFITGSTFFQRFNISDTEKNKILADDQNLLSFGLKWLKFSLFGEKIFSINENFEKTKTLINKKKKD